MTADRVVFADRVALLAVWLAALVIVLPFLWLVLDVARQGIPALSLDFLLEAPRAAGRDGGIGPVLVSTGLILATCMAVALPVGLGTALFLSGLAQRGRTLGTLVRRSLDILAGVPSIVFGLFGNAFFAVTLGLGFSILAGGLTLACMILPLVIRTTEAGLRSVPQEYRLGAAALGLSQTTTLFRILLPVAAPALMVGLVLGIGRALAETAALLFTSGYGLRMPGSLLESGRSLSVHIYDLAMHVPGGEPMAFASAFVLMAILVGLNTLTFWIGDRSTPRRRLLQ